MSGASSAAGVGERALVIGGTGPTGPHVVRGLLERGYDVTVLHTGRHEAACPVLSAVRHIHADPHFAESLTDAVAGERFDVVVAQYGRLSVVSAVFAGRVPRVVAIGAAFGLLAPRDDPRWGLFGQPGLVVDEVYADETAPGLRGRIVAAMEDFLARSRAGLFAGAYLALPTVYGARNPGCYDWLIVRRCLDGRRSFVLADGGMKLESRVAAANAAHATLLAVDRPDLAANRRWVVTDATTLTVRQRVDFIAARLGHELQIVDAPYPVAWPSHPLLRHSRHHRVCSGENIRRELGHGDVVSAADALGRTVDWMVRHTAELRGEAAPVLGDPFDYAAEDVLADALTSQRLPALPTLPVQPHPYPHPVEMSRR